MERIRADFGVFEDAEQMFHRDLNALRVVLSDLDGRLRASLAQWDGDACKAYQVAHEQWREASADVADRLAWLHQVLATSHGNYRSSYSANSRMWGGA